MFRYETHLHTAEGSGCASASGAEQARRYKALGWEAQYGLDEMTADSWNFIKNNPNGL